ncbi:hypothetical protein QUF80_04780 [Desulfococcaceae bacterium HSG8]|nr:hypothetical protein [Desulfococcaceae bacterium HSG8]
MKNMCPDNQSYAVMQTALPSDPKNHLADCLSSVGEKGGRTDAFGQKKDREKLPELVPQ